MAGTIDLPTGRLDPEAPSFKPPYRGPLIVGRQSTNKPRQFQSDDQTSVSTDLPQPDDLQYAFQEQHDQIDAVRSEAMIRQEFTSIQPSHILANTAELQAVVCQEFQNKDHTTQTFIPTTPAHNINSQASTFQLIAGIRILTDRQRRKNRSRLSQARKVLFEFETIFGRDLNDLEAWQALCVTCGLFYDRLPQTVEGCRTYMKTVFVNVYDLVDAGRNRYLVQPIFDNAADLKAYSTATNKLFPAHINGGNNLFRFMLKKWQ